jgi:hypothetical protein
MSKPPREGRRDQMRARTVRLKRQTMGFFFNRLRLSHSPRLTLVGAVARAVTRSNITVMRAADTHTAKHLSVDAGKRN